MLYFAAWLGFVLLYYVARYRRKVVRQNLGKAFPDKTSKEIAVLEKKFYRRLSQVGFEILKARRMTPEDFQQRVVLVNPELLQTYTNNFKDSVILLTIHQGNWEWMLHGVATALNVPMDPVYKPLHIKAADKLIFDIRSRFGSRPLTIAESVKDILRRRKEFRIFVMVADQSPIPGERCHWTAFMNQPSAFYLGTEIIAKMTRFPVLFARCRRLKTGYYELEFQEVAKPPYEKDSHEITERYVERAEAAIREDPESWLWSNQRWKRDPIAEEALGGENESKRN